MLVAASALVLGLGIVAAQAGPKVDGSFIVAQGAGGGGGGAGAGGGGGGAESSRVSQSPRASMPNTGMKAKKKKKSKKSSM
jgi:hypothetical protein